MHADLVGPAGVPSASLSGRLSPEPGKITLQGVWPFFGPPKDGVGSCGLPSNPQKSGTPPKKKKLTRKGTQIRRNLKRGDSLRFLPVTMTMRQRLKT